MGVNNLPRVVTQLHPNVIISRKTADKAGAENQDVY